MTDILVPGSVANLGAGFDTLAVAVELYLRVRIVDVRGDRGAGLAVVNSRPPVKGENAVEQAFAAAARDAKGPVPSVVVEVESDEEILDGIQLLARTEGIFTEPAGGTTLAATRALIQRGVIKAHESVVVCITGNGYKTAEVVRDRVAAPTQIGRSLADFDRVIGSRMQVPASV